jgi:hypothetical protein
MTRSHLILRSPALGLLALALLLGMRISPLKTTKCDPDNGGLVLPEGFCATVVASQLGPVRQLAVAPNGDLYAALSGKPSDNTGGVLAFRDKDGDGKPDERASFGPELYFLRTRSISARLGSISIGRFAPGGGGSICW